MSDKLPPGTPTGVVQAVGVVMANAGNDPAARTNSINEIEQAMVKAIQEAQAQGVIDPEEIRKRMLAARDFTVNTQRTAE